jgi:SAM-dependent methyltransferase
MAPRDLEAIHCHTLHHPASSSSEGISVLAALHCPLCGHEGRSLWAGLRDRFFSAPGAWGIRQCEACQLWWLDPKPDEREIGRFYADYFTHTPVATDPVNSSVVRAYLRRYGYGGSRLLHAATRVVPWMDDLAGGLVSWLPARPNGTLLDVGCGSGEFLRRMRALGWAVRGVESDQAAVDIARRVHGLDVRTETLANLRDASFDAVTMHHVIEHVPDPPGFIRDAGRLLRQGGVLVIVTPNSQSLASGWFGRNWVHWDPPRHLHVFSRRSLRVVVERAGLSCKIVRTTARYARFAWSASSSIRASGGKADSGRARGFARAQSLAFQLYEHLLVSWRREAGEEIVLIAGAP